METDKLLQQNTDKISTLCRNIVYALIATTWLLFSHSLYVSIVPWIFIVLVLYLFIDVLQYLSKVVLAHISYYKEFKGVTLKYLERMDKRIDTISYLFFYLKLMILLVAIILLIVSIFSYQDILLYKF